MPLLDEDDPAATPVQGYYRNYGIRAAPRRVPDILVNAVSDGVIDWDKTEWNLVDPVELDGEIRARIEPVLGEGIWYKSGRALYADPDLEPPLS